MNDRENEIYKQGVEEVKNTYAFIHDEEFSCKDMADMFLKGAQYADQHPRKGLWDSEKVIEWIRNNFSCSGYGFPLRYHHVSYQPEDIVKDLRKAMED